MSDDENISFLVHESYGMVAAGAFVTIVARPQTQVIKPYKLFIEAWIADQFVIQDIRVGNRSMFPMTQNLPALQFSNGDGHPMKVDPIMCSQDFVMIVTNTGDTARTFRGSWSCRLPREVAQLAPLRKFRQRKDSLHLPEEYLLPTDYSEPAFEEQADSLGEIKSGKTIRNFRTVEKDPHLRHIKHNPKFGWDPGYGDD